MEITLGQEDNVGEKPTVILYIYINRHAGTPVAEGVYNPMRWAMGQILAPRGIG